jgi:catechol 2,3-dioxygenase-like lactoylglutathione lyase family enzyme
MPDATDVSLHALFQVNVPVKDIERAVAFYRDVLGLPLQARRDGLAFLSVGPVRLLVERVEEEGGRYGHPGSILYFSVPDIHRAHAELAERGVRFIELPAIVSQNAAFETWMAFFEDGDWNTHAIVAQVPCSGARD